MSRVENMGCRVDDESLQVARGKGLYLRVHGSREQQAGNGEQDGHCDAPADSMMQNSRYEHDLRAALDCHDLLSGRRQTERGA